MNSKDRFSSIDYDNSDNNKVSMESLNNNSKEKILKEIDIVKQDLINRRKKNKILCNKSHPRQGNFHYPTRDESIRYWSWKKRHPDNAGM